MALFDDHGLPSVETTSVTNIDSIQSTTVTEKLTDSDVHQTSESILAPEVHVDPEAVQNATVEVPPIVPAKDEPFTKSTVNETILVKKEPVVESEELMQPKLADTKPISGSQQQQQQIWSSTLRSMVSADDDEVLSDTPLSNKAVIDGTPHKHSKLLVPIIQTVSPSPEHLSKQKQQPPSPTKKLSYLKEEPIPSLLDVPDKKDLDPNVKQDLCGCTIM